MITIKQNQTEVLDITGYLSDDQHSLHYISSTMHGHDSEVTAKESVEKIKISELHHLSHSFFFIKHKRIKHSLQLARTELFHKVCSLALYY